MAKGKNRKVKAEELGFNMAKYAGCEPIVEQCTGCDNIFLYTQDDVVHESKCKICPNPAVKWPRAGVQYAMETVSVRRTNDKGKIEVVKMELPKIDHRCPYATHIERYEIVDTSEKIRAGQQRQIKRR